MATTPQYRSRFGDTTLTKVFVGGLAWETPSEELRRHFDQFGEILEAVVITDKNTGRSKGYGFVTFREADSARCAVADPNPMIDGRRANCNIAAFGRPRPSPPRGRAQVGNPNHQQQGGPQPAGGPPYSRYPPQMPPPPPPVMYPPHYGYVTYTPDYGYQPVMYNTQFSAQYHPQQVYGPSSPSSTYPYSSMGYVGMQSSPQAGFSAQPIRIQGQTPPLHPPQPYVGMSYPTIPGEGTSFIPSSSHPYGFQLQAPPIRQAHQSPDSEAPQQQHTTTEASNETSPDA